MTRLTDVDDAPVVEHGTRRAHFIRQIRLGKYQAQLREVLIAADDGIRELARVGGKLKQDALDLLLLLALEDADVVVRLHDAHRLDKDRLTARGAVVHQSGDVVAALGLDGHDVPAVALGDDGVLKIFDVLGAVNDLVQHLARLGGRGADLAADVGQRGTRLVRNFILADDRRGDALLEILVRNQSAEIAVERGFHVGAATVPLLDGADDVHGARDREKLSRCQTAARLRAPEVACAVFRAAEGRCAETSAQSDRVVGLPQQQLGFFEVENRLQGERVFSRVVERRLCREPLENLVQF